MFELASASVYGSSGFVLNVHLYSRPPP